MSQPSPSEPSGAPARSDAEAVSVWLFPRGVDLALLTRASLDEIEPPDLRVRVLAEGDGTLTVEVVEGVAPYDADGLLFVERHGAHEVLHRDVSPGGRAPCVRLTLAPWPRR